MSSAPLKCAQKSAWRTDLFRGLMKVLITLLHVLQLSNDRLHFMTIIDLADLVGIKAHSYDRKKCTQSHCPNFLLILL